VCVGDQIMGSFLPDEITKVVDSGIAFIYSFQPIIEPTVVLGLFIHPQFYAISKAFDISHHL
jgi:hypothetical protein